MLQEMVGVFSDPEWGTTVTTLGIAVISLVLWMMRELSSRSNLVMVPPGLFYNTNALEMYAVQG